jgi:mono/diheme cytochrome c family protein
MSGPRIGGKAYSIETLTVFLRTPAGQMPPYSNRVLSDSDIADIAEFMKLMPNGAASGH